MSAKKKSVEDRYREIRNTKATHNFFVGDRFDAGLALLGTNLLQEHVRVLQEYERVYIALDKDATDKALDMVRRLYFLVLTSLAVLQHDLKNMMDDERDEYIEERIA